MLKLLLEIGLEELPASFIAPTLQQIATITDELLTEARLSDYTISTFATPRRLTLMVNNLPGEQPDLSEELKGPPARIAYDKDGNLTKAALGFARKLNVSPEDLYTKDLKGQAYLYASLKTTGQVTEVLLPDLLTTMMSRLNFPKPMRWGMGTVLFARPIRWIVALLDDQVLPLNFAGIESDRISRSHRFLGNGDIQITSVDDYLATLRNQYVIVDITERRTMILDQIVQLERENAIKVEIDRDLLAEVVNLVEYPTAFLGSFKANYLQLPEEAIITPMQDHQRYFPVRDLSGKLVNHFVGVRNGVDLHLDQVIAGNEKVLVARLADARFFFDEDCKHPLDYFIEKLKAVVFQQELGTIFHKIERIVNLAHHLSISLHLSPAEQAVVTKAAQYCKADLASNMVHEFPELQGIMGEKYARHAGLPEAVALAIGEHYRPQGEDSLPQTQAGQLVAIADKIDTIVGCTAVGLKATGSQDPYKLRRQIAGIARIIIECELPIAVDALINKAMQNFHDLQFDHQLVKEEVNQLLQNRLRYILQNDYNLSYDVIDCMLGGEVDDLAQLVLKANALSAIKDDPAFGSLITAFKRANNLAQKADVQSIRPESFVDRNTRELYEAFLAISTRYEDAYKRQDYLEALKAFAQLEKPINHFFDDVMVMADDLAVRHNRLALLQAIVNIVQPFADLTKLVVE